jgi:hypothetical protein
MSRWKTIQEFIDWQSKKEMTDINMLNEFIKLNNFTKYISFCNESRSLKRLFETGIDTYEKNNTYELPPKLDHSFIFKNTRDGICCLVYQPYFEDTDIRAEVKDWANKHELKASVYSSKYSFYYPHATCVVIISLKDIDIRINNQTERPII